MPLRLEIKKLLMSRSERVKSCDLHPDEPWVLSALYTGHLFIWNYITQTVVKSFEATDQPIRCAKFITRKQWVICGADDMMIRVFNFNTLEKVREFEAHIDYIRYIDVHPTQPYVISSSDDMQIKLWDWERGWSNTQTFEGHAHYVMQVKFNPKDSNTFASASLDKSVKVWSIGSPLPNYSLEGHERGVNCIDYYLGGDKPYLVSGADDKCVKIWDYQTKSCVQTLEGHTSNVSAVCFHPKLPIILSGSEDGTIRMWHSTTYRLETTLNYGMERCWTLAVTHASNKVAVGYDEGTIVITLGQEMPVVSIDNSGKVLMANNNEILSCSMRGVASQNLGDGEVIEFQTKDLGSCEIFPQRIMHNSNGRFVAVCGDGEYIIYTAQALRNKSFGSGLDFVWSSDGTGDYAVRETSSRIRVFKNFKETQSFKPPFSAEALFGGNLIGIAGNDFIVFYDWAECSLIMRIDVAPESIFWSQDGEHVVLACSDSFFVLRCDLASIADAFANGRASPEDGVEAAFTLLHEIGEKVQSGQWVGGCFLYTNSANRLNYYVGGEVMTLSHLDRQMFLMGFVAKENRVFLIDKNRTIVSYELLESVLQYQTAVVRQDFDLANNLLETIPRERYNDISRFLESQGHKEFALHVADDPDQRIELALQLGKLEMALEIMQKEIVPKVAPDDTETQSRWKQLGDLALSNGDLALAEKCAQNASDFSGLLLMYTSSGNAEGIAELLETTDMKGLTNISFVCSLLCGNLKRCVDILHRAKRHAEAAFFARTFVPSATAECVKKWREDLFAVNPRAAQALANPAEQPELFPSFDDAIKVENLVRQEAGGRLPLASSFLEVIKGSDSVLVDLVRDNGPQAIKELFANFENSAPVTSQPIPAAEDPPMEPQIGDDLIQFEQEDQRKQLEEEEMLRRQQEAEDQEREMRERMERERQAKQEQEAAIARQKEEEEELTRKRMKEELERQEQIMENQRLLEEQRRESERIQKLAAEQEASKTQATTKEDLNDDEIQEALQDELGDEEFELDEDELNDDFVEDW